MKKLFLIFLFLFIVIIVSIAVLETLSRNYQCKDKPSTYGICFSDRISIFLQTSPELEKVIQKRMAGQKIFKEKYRQLSDKSILEVPPEKLAGFYNGIACGNYGYVRNDLPNEAKKFVKRHELEHLLQTGEEKNAEFSATWAAAKEYPFGFIETIFFTVKNWSKYFENPVCYIVSLWKTFKIYLLP